MISSPNFLVYIVGRPLDWKVLKKVVRAFFVKSWQHIWTDCIYVTDYEMGCCQNLRLVFGSFLGQFVQKSMIFAKNEEKKIVDYCKPTLLKDVNLFRITAYMPLIV